MGFASTWRRARAASSCAARCGLEEGPKGQALVITEIPYGTKDKIKESIAKAINERKVEGLWPRSATSPTRTTACASSSACARMPIPRPALNALYQYSSLQQNYSAQMVFLMGQPGVRAVEPRQVGMLEILNHWNGHQIDVLTKRLEHELRKAKERLHVVQGLIIGAANAQQIVKIFQQSADRAAAKEEIKRKYKLSEIQAEVIAAMTLSQVTRLDAGRYEVERKALEARIAEIEAVLADREKLVALLKSEYKTVKDKFTDPRRTAHRRRGRGRGRRRAEHHRGEGAARAFSGPDGTLRVNPVEAQAPGEEGLPGAFAQFEAKTTDYVLFISDQGKVYALRGNKPAGDERQGRVATQVAQPRRPRAGRGGAGDSRLRRRSVPGAVHPQRQGKEVGADGVPSAPTPAAWPT